MYKQLNYIQTKNIGFNKEQVLVIHGTGALRGAKRGNATIFKDELLKLAGVKSGTGGGYTRRVSRSAICKIIE